jgi:Major Facilitator Superfamily
MVEYYQVSDDPHMLYVYAGLLASSFSFAQCVASLVYGSLSDRFGRRPILLWGLLANALALLAFGFAQTYWQAMLFRILGGVLNGNMPVAKCYMGEVTHPRHHQKVFSLVGLVWSTGNVVGPALGGFLAIPADLYPNVFSQTGLFGRNPFLLPCVVMSAIQLSGFVVGFFRLKEPLHTQQPSEIAEIAVELAELHPSSHSESHPSSPSALLRSADMGVDDVDASVCVDEDVGVGVDEDVGVGVDEDVGVGVGVGVHEEQVMDVGMRLCSSEDNHESGREQLSHADARLQGAGVLSAACQPTGECAASSADEVRFCTGEEVPDKLTETSQRNTLIDASSDTSSSAPANTPVNAPSSSSSNGMHGKIKRALQFVDGLRRPSYRPLVDESEFPPVGGETDSDLEGYAYRASKGARLRLKMREWRASTAQVLLTVWEVMRIRNVLVVTTLYSLIGIQWIMFDETFSMWAKESYESGGMSFSTSGRLIFFSLCHVHFLFVWVCWCVFAF